MKPTNLLLALSLSLGLLTPLRADEPKPVPPVPAVPAAEAPRPPAGQARELTREEIAQLGGFEPAPEDNLHVTVRIDVLMVKLPEELAVPLIEMFRDPERAAAAGQQVRELLREKKAKLTGWPSVITRDSNRAVAENIQEVRYPIEFEEAKDAHTPADPAPAPRQEDPPPGPPMPLVAGMVPTTFETRNVGATLEVEPTIWPDGQRIDVNLSVQHVRLLGWDISGEHENGKPKRAAPQPRFQTNRISQTFIVQSGDQHFLGSFPLPGEPGQVELFILNAQLRKEAPKAKPAR